MTETMDRPKTQQEQREEWEVLLLAKATACLSQGGSDGLKGSARMMAREVRADPRLAGAVMDIILEDFCNTYIRKAYQKQNSAAWYKAANATKATSPEAPGGASGRLRRAIHVAAEARLMEYRLLHGQILGDATAKDIKKNYEFQLKQAKRMSETGAWMLLLWENARAHPHKRLRDIFTEDELMYFQERAINTVADIKLLSKDESNGQEKS